MFVGIYLAVYLYVLNILDNALEITVSSVHFSFYSAFMNVNLFKVTLQNKKQYKIKILI